MARDAEKLAAQGERIRELRKFARVTQETAAGAVGVTLRGYQRWERGEGELKPDNVRALAEYFATTPDYVEYGERIVVRTPSLALDADGEMTQADRIEAKIDELLRRLPEALPAPAVDPYPPELEAVVQTVIHMLRAAGAQRDPAPISPGEYRRGKGRSAAA